MTNVTTWTDEEFATVAGALLYPESRRAAVVSGYSPAVPMAWELDGRLQQLGPQAKARALVLAQQIRAGEAALLGAALGGDAGCGDFRDGAVIQVGDIKFDPRLGRTERESMLARARGLLASMVDFVVNPNAQLGVGGGINGTCGP